MKNNYQTKTFSHGGKIMIIGIENLKAKQKEKEKESK